MIDLGDTLPDFGVDITDPAGTPVTPGSIGVTLTYPGPGGVGYVTVSDLDVLSLENLGVGAYVVRYRATSPGTHRATWTMTGDHAGVLTQTWEVSDQGVIVSVSDIRAHLRVFKPEVEEELRDLALVVSDVCERYTRRTWRPRAVVGEVHTGTSGRILLDHVGISGQVTLGEVGLDGAVVPYTGVLRVYARRGVVEGDFFGDVEVSYTAGPPQGRVPAHIRHGCLLLAAHIWATQRGGSNMPRLAGADEEVLPVLSMIPTRVRQVWGTPRLLVV